MSNEDNERSQAVNVQRELWEGVKRRSIGSTGVVNGVKGKDEYPIGDLKTIDGKGRMPDGNQGMEPKGGSEYSTGVVKQFHARGVRSTKVKEWSQAYEGSVRSMGIMKGVVEKRRMTDGSYERNQIEVESAQRQF